MNRNVESHFSIAPQADIRRSSFDMSHTHKTTFNAGALIPIDWQEVLPGDTFSVDTSLVTRMTTPIFPVMDNCYLDYYYFFVPNRLLWEHWEQFCGANDDITAWEQPVIYEVPQVTAPSGGWTEGTLADYLGVPTKVPNISVSALPFRAYAKIYNDFFRDENVVTPCNLPLSDTTQSGSNGTTQVTDVVNGGAPAKVMKYHDYFTSALPFVQRGPEVTIPLGDDAPVFAGTSDHTITTGNPIHFVQPNGNSLPSGKYPMWTEGTSGALKADYSDSSLNNVYNLVPSNLYADLNLASSATINELRQAFQIQRLYEATARSGSRYIEILKGLFGVTSPDARLQRSEYLGGKRIPINMQQVLQTSSTDSTTPQGNTAAYSLTSDRASSFTKSFVEHGILMCVAAVRTQHTYQQGLEQKWTRKRRFDFYYPQLAHLGEQPVFNKEIYCQGSSVVNANTGVAYDDEVFGYQEAWATYRYQNSRVSGLFRSNASGSLDAWHYADNYASLPVLGDTWMSETDLNIQRTLAVSGEDQFIADFYFKTKAVRPMPMYSVPGLIDHN